MCWSWVSTQEEASIFVFLLLLPPWLSIVLLARSIYTMAISQHCTPDPCWLLICAAPWASKAHRRQGFRQSLA